MLMFSKYRRGRMLRPRLRRPKMETNQYSKQNLFNQERNLLPDYFTKIILGKGNWKVLVGQHLCTAIL